MYIRNNIASINILFIRELFQDKCTNVPTTKIKDYFFMFTGFGFLDPFLRTCSWLGTFYPCGLFFKRVITETGICCSTTNAVTEGNFDASEFSSLISRLMDEDLNISLSKFILPCIYAPCNKVSKSQFFFHKYF